MEFLQNFSIEQLFILVVLCVGAIDSVIQRYAKWSNAKKDFVKKEHEKEELPERVKKLEDVCDEQDRLLDILVRSDRNAIKGELVKQCKEFEKQGYIDELSFDYLMQRYSIYKEENGNSWAEYIVDRIKKIPMDTQYFSDYKK